MWPRIPWRLRGESPPANAEPGVWSLSREDPTSLREAGPANHSYRAVPLEPASATNALQLLKPGHPRFLLRNKGRRLQWEAHALQLERALTAWAREEPVQHRDRAQSNTVVKQKLCDQTRFRDGCERDHGMQSSWNTHRWGTTKQNRIASIIKQSCRLLSVARKMSTI